MRRHSKPHTARHGRRLVATAGWGALALALGVLASVLLSVVDGGGASSAAKARQPQASDARKRRVYCTRHRHPRGCVKVPASVIRPGGSNQQGPASLTPDEVEHGGGTGAGGPEQRGTSAIRWAKGEIGLERWAWYCERFVEEAFGTRGRYATAAKAGTKLTLHRGGSVKDAPAGSLVYFKADSSNRWLGHVGIALGRGRMISALKTVEITNVARSRYFRGLYLGWVEAPPSWPGRIPPPPADVPADAAFDVLITAPAPGSVQSGTIGLVAESRSAPGVQFQAFYADDPADPASRRWHDLGTPTKTKVGWELAWNTNTVPDQGSSAWGTVNVAAVVLDGEGRRTGTRDYRRIRIDNGPGPQTTVPTTPITVPTTPTTTTPPPPPPPRQTYAETTGGYAHTWSDPSSAGGVAGPPIEGQQTVQVDCRLEGYKVQDGNTWWYHLPGSPWNGDFYVTADAFYNNGATSGPLDNTPFYDPAVPVC